MLKASILLLLLTLTLTTSLPHPSDPLSPTENLPNYTVLTPNSQTVVKANIQLSIRAERPISSPPYVWKLRDYRRDSTTTIDAAAPAEKVWVHVSKDAGNFTVWHPKADLKPGALYSLWMVRAGPGDEGTEVFARSQMFTVINPEYGKEVRRNTTVVRPG
ncbi:hypothetical protein BJ508DRAFT_64619 [Ascobolus immersus RN42]|uniref:Uncharacterized protein n=1 Tax=Ascobolus immersus RN42 TaxID=1160509 RepID=A0A3N4INS4_ASCIM|nr:hypothetical protein BJ508DRAFT_64619 [Ascobolus immersus RN42]